METSASALLDEERRAFSFSAAKMFLIGDLMVAIEEERWYAASHLAAALASIDDAADGIAPPRKP
jgi:hypothetical protein